MTIQSQIDVLCGVTHELLNLGFDGNPIYSNRFCELNTEVYRQCESLYPLRGCNSEEEALLCYNLLAGYHATIYDNGDKNQKIQSILGRCWVVLGELSASLLKCQLLVACYGEVFDENLAEEAHAIIKSWNGRVLTEPEREVSEYLNYLEANSCLGWEIE